jgi:hypothetical protein
MPEFDFLLKQINEKIEKTSNKIQTYAVKIIPLEEERDRLEIARKGLEGDVIVPKDSNSDNKRFNLRDVIFDTVRNREGLLDSSDIRLSISKEYDYTETYIYTKLSTLHKEGFLKKDKHGRFSMRDVGPAPEVKREITSDPNEKTFDSFPAL